MIRNRNEWLPFAALLLGAGFSAPAAAAEEDTQLWIYTAASMPLGDTGKATLQISPRFTETGDILQSRLMADFDLADGVQLGGGLTNVEYAGGHEWRTHQQLGLKAGRLSSRTRFEQRFFSGADRAQLRLRQRVQLSQPVAPDTDLVGNVELLYILQDDDPAQDASVDSWRFKLRLDHDFTENLTIGAGYMLLLRPRDGEDRISHVPQLTLSYGL